MSGIIAELRETNRQLTVQVDSVSRTYGYDHAHMAARIAGLEADKQAAREDAEHARADLALLRNIDSSKFAVAMHERAERAEAARAEREKDVEHLVEWLVTQHDYDEAVVRSGLADLRARAEKDPDA